ncbi:hypothetical protein [Streptomyces sp. FL07-04A]|uniref:hypothetical protein n=1 Tax=Streptomyces sp. FL07-04A TaxID=3028658 RepID=UPI0029BBD172|nr:hypothetical protein [Streptomyces sp. FL07-04A]MDX3578655.1 hypothetical protein [Streptomyces sp. FL07-04A]
MGSLTRGLSADYPLPCRVYKGLDVIACPVCGAADDLVVSIDGDDASETASYMRCPDEHRWAEPRFSRRFGVELLQSYLEAGKHL